jgi:hypothetical protein
LWLSEKSVHKFKKPSWLPIISPVEKDSRQRSDDRTQKQADLFSIHRSENSKPGARPAAIVIQVRMKQPAPATAAPRTVLYKKADEFWLSNQGK